VTTRMVGFSRRKVYLRIRRVSVCQGLWIGAAPGQGGRAVTPRRLSRQGQELPHGGRARAPGVSPVRGVRADISPNTWPGDSARPVRAQSPSLFRRPGAARSESRAGHTRPRSVVSTPPATSVMSPAQTVRAATSYRLVPIHLHDVRVTEMENCTRPKYALRCQGDLRFSFPRAASLMTSDTLAPRGVHRPGMAGRSEPVGARGGYSPGANPVCRAPMRGRKEG
jgi:hypothetical protein